MIFSQLLTLGVLLCHPRLNGYGSSLPNCARQAAGFGYGTVVLQSGEDAGVRRDWLSGVVSRIKDETGLAVTLSVGERSPADLAAWRAAGADRYLLRFETSSRKLFARIACPRANIPSTTALATLNLAEGREIGLQRGANVVMPNLTPLRYRQLYEIYPAKACLRETAEECHGCLRNRIERLGRTIGTGRGDSNRGREIEHRTPNIERPTPK